jgi:hypothetical protein
MKHLVKFNESIESSEWNDVDVEYFKNCFIDFDKGATIRPIFMENIKQAIVKLK